MGLGDADLLDDGDVGGGKGMVAVVPCSICLDAVTDNGDRSWAKLHCGHQFHLDCIGSAFNIKGAMQCPNCRKIEKGQWLYANGGRPIDFGVDDWHHDDDMYEFGGYSEMSFGVHWCPFPRLSFDEGDFPSSGYHDIVGHHAVFAEHSSTNHPCPYIAYFGPIHPSSSSASNGNISDGSSFNNHWNALSAHADVPNAYPFPSMEPHYAGWDHSPPFVATSRIGNADQPSIPSLTQRAARTADPRPVMHPFIVGHSSGSRAPTSVTSSVLPPYPGPVARPRDRPLQGYFQQSTTLPVAARASLISGGRRATSHRGLPQVAPIASSSDQASAFYFFSSNSSGRAFQEAENPARDHFHAWEREHQPVFPIDRDSIWAPFQGHDGGVRSSSFRQRQSGGSERMPSQNR